MPPEGYTTLTLPDELIERIDMIDAPSRAKSIEWVFDDRDELLTNHESDNDVSPVTLEATEHGKIADEVVRRLER